MPVLYRTMRMNKDGLPELGDRSKQLGVRTGQNEHTDIDTTEFNMVVLNGKGMSVCSHWLHLPDHLIPRRIMDENGEPIGIGSNNCYIFRHGSGPFDDGGYVSDDLILARKQHNADLGCVVPAQTVSVEDYQAMLAATQQGWVVDESVPPAYPSRESSVPETAQSELRA